jgi:O-antigen ligase
MRFFEIAAAYPFGNGLGGGGTSIPYFLQDEIRNPVAMENEYARIMLEQGVVGLVFWIAFIVWILSRRNNATDESSRLGRRLAKTTCLVFFIASAMGTGLLTSIPQTSLFLLLVGWVGTRQTETEAAANAMDNTRSLAAPLLAVEKFS